MSPLERLQFVNEAVNPTLLGGRRPLARLGSGRSRASLADIDRQPPLDDLSSRALAASASSASGASLARPEAKMSCWMPQAARALGREAAATVKR